MPSIAKATRKLEQVEMAAWADLYRAGQELGPRPGGVQLAQTDRYLASLVPECDILAMNRVLGLGQNGPITDAVLRELIDLYRRAGAARFFVALHPEVLTVEAHERLATNGFEVYNNWVKLSREAVPLEIRESELEIEEVGPEAAAPFARIVASCFEWDPRLLPWLEAVVGRPGWHCYLAYDGDKPVATGAFYHHEDAAWIDLAATLPSYRGRGAQAGLLKRRIDDAIAIGCTELVVETAQETAAKSAPSYRNMVRYGFEEAYTRPNYIFRL